MASLTDKEIAKAISDAKKTGRDVHLTDASKARGTGRLRVRACAGGQCFFYFRYFDSAGKQDQLTVGVYDSRGKRGLTLRNAREKAGEWSRLYQSGQHDLRIYLAHQEAEERAQMESAARARAEAQRQATSGSFRALMDGYIAHLERQGKSSARDARNLFRYNIYDDDAYTHLAAMPAREITHEDISAILARLVNRGAGRSAGKLRAYLRAAFAAALQAASDATIHPALHGFNLTTNPAAIVPARPLARFNVARERELNTSELHAFLKAAEALPAGVSRDVLSLCLLLGGQRPAQLVRAKPSDVDMDERTITLFDIKGARKHARTHRLPLTERAGEIVERLLKLRKEDDEPLPYLFTTNGKVPVRVETISGVVNEIRDAMLKAKTARASFGLRDIRRTCETMLAGMGVSKDIRAQLLSHGLGGVQDRHYDRYAYMNEKRQALEAWDQRLLEIASDAYRTNVVPMKRPAVK